MQSPDSSMLKALDAPERAQEDILDDVFGVAGAACVAWKAAVGPSPDRRQRALDQNRRRLWIAGLGALQDVQGRIRRRVGACTLESTPIDLPGVFSRS